MGAGPGFYWQIRLSLRVNFQVKFASDRLTRSGAENFGSRLEARGHGPNPRHAARPGPTGTIR
jgi:hypothetical protein